MSKNSIDVAFVFPAENVTVIMRSKRKHNLRDISVYQIGLLFVNFPGIRMFMNFLIQIYSLMVKHGWCRDMTSFGPKKASWLIFLTHSLSHLRAVVKKTGLFTVRLTVRGGGGVSPLGPDCKQM